MIPLRLPESSGGHHRNQLLNKTTGFWLQFTCKKRVYALYCGQVEKSIHTLFLFRDGNGAAQSTLKRRTFMEVTVSEDIRSQVHTWLRTLAERST